MDEYISIMLNVTEEKQKYEIYYINTGKKRKSYYTIYLNL